MVTTSECSVSSISDSEAKDVSNLLLLFTPSLSIPPLSLSYIVSRRSTPVSRRCVR